MEVTEKPTHITLVPRSRSVSFDSAVNVLLVHEFLGHVLSERVWLQSHVCGRCFFYRPRRFNRHLHVPLFQFSPSS